MTGPPNDPPFQPELAITPAGIVAVDADLNVAVTGPDPADPNGHAVTYEYRWFLNTGTGGFLDPSFHGRGTSTGPSAPASATAVGDQWRVQVTPRDELGDGEDQDEHSRDRRENGAEHRDHVVGVIKEPAHPARPRRCK